MKTIRFLVLALLAICGTWPTMRAQDVAFTLDASAVTLSAGSELRVALLVLNNTSHEIGPALPMEITGRLTKGDESWPITLRGTGGSAVVAAGRFARVVYSGALPRGALGRMVLELEQPSPLRGVVEVSGPDLAPLTSDSGRIEPSQAPIGAEALLATKPFQRYYADHFSAHEPIYFVYGTKAPAIKFQFSFKYRILNDGGPLATRFPALKGLHIGYTQRSLWDIKAKSSPFYDSSYMPEMIFQSLATDPEKYRAFTWLGYQVGVQHESNGRAGSASRSLNTLYYRTVFVFGEPNGWRLASRPKVQVFLDSLEDNPDLKKYRGYGELRAIFGKANGLSLSATGRLGDEFTKGSAQFDVSYPTEFLSGNFAMYLMAQYWTGYGESLLNYKQRSAALRAGISIAR